MTSVAERISEVLATNIYTPSTKKKSWLAEQLGYSPQLISKWLNSHAVPDINQIQKIAEVLACDPAYLAFGTPIRHFDEELLEVTDAFRRKTAVYAWMARACHHKFNWKPVFNRPGTDALVVTAEDVFDIHVVNASPVKSPDTLGNWIDIKSYKLGDSIFRAPVPPQNFYGYVPAVIDFELPRGNQFVFVSFHSDMIRDYTVTLESGQFFVYRITDHERYLLPPKGSGLEPIREVPYSDFEKMEPFIHQNQNIRKYFYGYHRPRRQMNRSGNVVTSDKEGRKLWATFLRNT
tara:strand:- start:1051 stop:1923 length:873 start_codon:yes stop_codon:yes gene_type:complete